jgi:hypothetical protein
MEGEGLDMESEWSFVPNPLDPEDEC